MSTKNVKKEILENVKKAIENVLKEDEQNEVQGGFAQPVKPNNEQAPFFDINLIC